MSMTDLRSLLHRCEECNAVGEPEDNRHKPWCSHVNTKTVRCPKCNELGESNLRDTELTCPSCGHSWSYMKSETITPLELAFTIQDPCGDDAINLAREVLRLVSDRSDNVCKQLTVELRRLNDVYQRG